MKINLLHILLILVALQSTVAVADLHQSHQSGEEHLEFNHIDDEIHDSEYSKNNSGVQSLANNSNSYDCHHCCHCHGVANPYLVNQHNNEFTYIKVTRYLINSILYSSRTTSPAHRPPIV